MLSVGQLWVVGRCMESPIDVDRQETRHPCGHVHSLTGQLSEINYLLPGRSTKPVSSAEKNRTQIHKYIQYIQVTLPAADMYRYLRLQI